MVRIGVYGATGYTGFELLRLLRRHPQTELVFATSESAAGQTLADLYPVPWEVPLVHPEEADPAQADVVFLCLPHGASAPTAVRALEAGVRVIDLSADFRLATPEAYARWYGLEHPAPTWLPQAVYGLTELYREPIAQARLVANPGCYPTGTLLGLAPLLRVGLVADGPIIVDAKSGVSGAGRKPRPTTHFVAVHDNLAPYSVGRVHRHVGEMEQEVAKLAGDPHPILFTPHLLPVSRGILSSLYVPLREPLDEAAAHALYAQAYEDEPFVWVLPPGRTATLAHAVGTNRCVLSLHPLPEVGHLLVIAALDNLVKGAAGQALQNLNVMTGLPETMGLTA